VSWFDQLNDGTAAADLMQWARSQASLRDAWHSCDRADWLFWLAAQIARDERERKHVAVAGGYVARRVRVRRLAPAIPTDADVAVLWASSVPRADSIEVMSPIVSFVLAAPIAFVGLAASAIALRRLGNLVWPIACTAFVLVWLPLALFIQRARVRGVVARLRSFDWDAARSGVSSALTKRVGAATVTQRQMLANELRAAIEEPGWLRLVSRRTRHPRRVAAIDTLHPDVEVPVSVPRVRYATSVG